MQALGGQDMGLEALEDRPQNVDAGADLVGERRQAQRHAFPGVAFGLAVQRLMLAELLEHDHRQQAGAGPAARDHMERRRRLGDGLAIAAGEPLAHGLDHLPLTRHDFEGLGDVLAELGEAQTAAARTTRRRRDHHPLARQCSGNGLRDGRLRANAATIVVLLFAAACSAASSSSVAVVSSSSSCSSS